MTGYHQLLAMDVLTYMEDYQNDFMVHDKRAFSEDIPANGTFLYGIRKTGTAIYYMDSDECTEREREIIRGAVKVFLFDANERFFWGHNGTVEEVHRNTAMRLFEEYDGAGRLFT